MLISKARQNGQAAWRGLIKKEPLHGPSWRSQSRAAPVRLEGCHKSGPQCARPNSRRPHCPPPPAPGYGCLPITHAPDTGALARFRSGHWRQSILMTCMCSTTGARVAIMSHNMRRDRLKPGGYAARRNGRHGHDGGVQRYGRAAQVSPLALALAFVLVCSVWECRRCLTDRTVSGRRLM